MNVKEMLKFLEEAKCPSSVKQLKAFKETLEAETCEVCIQGEDKGCKGCKIGEFLGDLTNMIFALLAALAVCVVLYYGLVKKGGKR